MVKPLNLHFQCHEFAGRRPPVESPAQQKSYAAYIFFDLNEP